VVVALVGGGSRSGKSRFALEYAERRFARPAFVATAQAFDEEMRARIAKHQAERGPRWTTIEEPLSIGRVLRENAGRFDGFLVDCLTLWLSNVLMTDEDPEAACERTLAELAAGPPCVLVTNEVGCGIVPENALARRFRDLAGGLNQRAAAAAEEVYWMAFGIPVTIKARR
jgi:adenosylcobinamide kinase/adenosylcobinamide-phosphate guanylyltransferase